MPIPLGLVIGPVNDGVGREQTLGLFAIQDFPADTSFGPYEGEIWSSLSEVPNVRYVSKKFGILLNTNIYINLRKIFHLDPLGAVTWGKGQMRVPKTN